MSDIRAKGWSAGPFPRRALWSGVAALVIAGSAVEANAAGPPDLRIVPDGNGVQKRSSTRAAGSKTDFEGCTTVFGNVAPARVKTGGSVTADGKTQMACDLRARLNARFSIHVDGVMVAHESVDCRGTECSTPSTRTTFSAHAGQRVRVTGVGDRPGAEDRVRVTFTVYPG